MTHGTQGDIKYEQNSSLHNSWMHCDGKLITTEVQVSIFPQKGIYEQYSSSKRKVMKIDAR